MISAEEEHQGESGNRNAIVAGWVGGWCSALRSEGRTHWKKSYLLSKEQVMWLTGRRELWAQGTANAKALRKECVWNRVKAGE